MSFADTVARVAAAVERPTFRTEAFCPGCVAVVERKAALQCCPRCHSTLITITDARADLARAQAGTLPEFSEADVREA